MPRYLKSLGLTDAENGYVQTLFALLQLCGGPMFGYMMQRHGIRFSLLLAYTCTALSGVLLTLSYDFPTVLLSRIPCVFMLGQQGHQTLISALTSAGQERTNAFGRMGLINGLGLIVTPICSIVVSIIFSENAPIIASAVLCVLPFFVLEKHLDVESHQKVKCETEPEAKLCLSDAIGVLKRPGVLNLYLINEFHADVKTGQLIQMMTGICLMCSSGFGVIWMRRRFSEEALLLAGMMAFKKCETESETKLCLSDAIGVLKRPGVLNLYLINEFNADVKTGQLIQMMTAYLTPFLNSSALIIRNNLFGGKY
ncbi:hypothetical protein ANCDUO_10178 [Ancylostoma duodenale]|uniref:Major facilitator superfamily (MFS) profile domain-containing protein n=1 Tax=Ancylostoma duodenale TaxID=51022 RepID=A0A0C2DB10_9BILA|nr:hypothetical protein ANCDUO_10178 [Ancylostoma duodenale]